MDSYWKMILNETAPLSPEQRERWCSILGPEAFAQLESGHVEDAFEKASRMAMRETMLAVERLLERHGDAAAEIRRTYDALRSTGPIETFAVIGKGGEVLGRVEVGFDADLNLCVKELPP